MAGWTYKVRKGGLLRCCLLNLDEQMAARLEDGKDAPRDGEKLRTECCDSTLFHRDGAWESAPSLDEGRHG